MGGRVGGRVGGWRTHAERHLPAHPVLCGSMGAAERLRVGQPAMHTCAAGLPTRQADWLGDGRSHFACEVRSANNLSSITS